MENSILSEITEAYESAFNSVLSRRSAGTACFALGCHQRPSVSNNNVFACRTHADMLNDGGN